MLRAPAHHHWTKMDTGTARRRSSQLQADFLAQLDAKFAAEEPSSPRERKGASGSDPQFSPSSVCHFPETIAEEEEREEDRNMNELNLAGAHGTPVVGNETDNEGLSTGWMTQAMWLQEQFGVHGGG